MSLTSSEPKGLGQEWYLRGRLRLRHLKLVKVLAETRNIGETANRLAITQPAASKMLGELEKLVGFPLFTRTSKGTFPTPHGESMIRHARWILGDLDRIGSDWEGQPSSLSERVVLGINSSSAAFLVPNALLRLERRAAQVLVVVREGSLEALVPQLLSHQIDLVVARLGGITEQAGLVTHPLSQESMCVVCSGKHPLAVQRKHDWSALARYPWIMPPQGSPVRMALDLILVREGVKPLAYVESASIMTNMVLMDNSHSLSLLPRGVAQYHADRRALAILGIDLPDIFGPLGIVRHSSLELSKGMQEVIDCLSDAALAGRKWNMQVTRGS